MMRDLVDMDVGMNHACGLFSWMKHVLCRKDAAMPAPGATLTSPDSITCRLCRHEIPLNASGHRPRRCPACKAWLAVRQPALLRKVSEGFVTTAREVTTDQDDQERVDGDASSDESAVEMGQGWRAVSNASLFHRFDESMMATVPDPPRASLESEVQIIPDVDDILATRRALTFAFKAPEVREQPIKEVTPVVWRDELAHRERLETSDDDAIEAWLDAVESEIFEEEHLSEPLFTDVSFDASLDPVAKRVDIDALQVHREDLEVHTLELEREPERFELKLGEQHIGPLDREGVNALIMSGLDQEALIRCQGQQRWGIIAQHDAFQALYELGAPQGTPGQEVDEAGGETMLLVPEDEPGDTLLGMPHKHEPGDTLMMFATPAPSPEEPLDEPDSAVLDPELHENEDVLEAQPLDIAKEAVPLSAVVAHEDVITHEQMSAQDALVPDMSSAPRRSIWRVMAIVVGVILIFALGSFAGVVVIESRTTPEDGPGARSAQELLKTMIMLPRERAAYQAVRGARTVVHLSSNQKFMTSVRQHEVALELVAAQDHVAALKVFGVLWTNVPARTPLIGLTYARSAQQLGQHDVARRVLIDAAGLKGADTHSEELGVAFNASVKQDEALHPEVLTLERDVHLDMARALGGGKSISLKLMKGGEIRYAFKPSQLDWAEGWRAEVAAYLFCEAIGCHFKVPRSLPARISREDFDELYGRFTSTKQKTYAEQFDEKLLWVKEPGTDGVEREYLYGVVKDWMPGFVDFPIEYKDIWDDWLDASKDPSVLNRDLRDALSSLRVRQDGKYFAAMMDERRGASTRDVARGISDILVFDYVTSNWDRYSGVETYYGVNNQFDEGEFLSLDNGAAFHILTQRKVEQRFEPVTRFSRSTISAMRLIQPDSVNDILFPEPRQEARQRLKVFWVQRDRLLARVDDLVQTHGESKVLFFE